MVLNELKNVFHIGKVITVSMHMYMMDCGLLALSEAERQWAMTIKSMSEALSCQGAPHRSVESISKEEQKHKRKSLVRIETLLSKKVE